MRSNNKGRAIAALILTMSWGALLEAQPKRTGAAMPRPMVADTPVLLGESYAVAGKTYVPSDPAYYDEVGYAGLMDAGSRGEATANGEVFAPAAISAAHKTLPLPSYVEVTSLDNGRTILVRVNDRGPMRGDQLIALSPGAAAQLGVSGAAMPVRVRRVNPPEQERAALRAQGRAAERLETPAALLKILRGKLPADRSAPVPAAPRVATAPSKPAALAGADFDKPQPRVPGKSVQTVAPKPVAPAPRPAPASKGGYVVQVGAFSSQARAEALAKSIGARVEAGGPLWRVRFGPYPTRQAAQAGVRSAAAKGFENARITANDAR